MALFALVANGKICQLSAAMFPVAPPMQWTTDVSRISPQPQDGWSATLNGQTWIFDAPPSPPSPTLAQQARGAAIGGLIVALSGSVALAATLFPTDRVTQQKLSAVVTTIAATGTFPGGATSYPLKDADGGWHTLTIDQYKVVAGAIAAYVAACDLIADGNPLSATELPASIVSLTV